MIYTEIKRKKPLALIVDDDPSLRMIISALLAKTGFHTLEAESGGKGVELFEAQQPDIVLMDVMMPDMDGFEACKMIRNSPKGDYTQILMVTGLEDTESIKKAFEAGANDFVTKPLNLTMLGQRVRYMLRAGIAFKELYISRSRLAKTQELAMIGNWQINLKTNEFHCSPEACSLLGLSCEGRDITLDDCLKPVIDQDRDRVKKSIMTTITTGMPATLEYRINVADAPDKYILNKSEIIFDEQHQPVFLLGVVQDISQLKKAEEEIRLLAFYDSLTGLANRMLFMDRLKKAIIDAERDKKHCALLFLDLDNFKRVNDTLGHDIGDLLLKKVAETIKKSIRAGDSATKMGEKEEKEDSLSARFGGDEFTVMIANLKKPENAAVIARRLLRAIPAVHNLDGHEVSITTSIGISIFPEDGNKSDILLKNADTAMYQAKKEGRNTYQFFMESMNRIIHERFSIDRDLRKAIKNNEFILYYQPQIRLADRKIVGAEALIRWHHPHRGMIPPDKFIPIAEETGMIIDINKWVLHAACLQNKKWTDLGFKPITIAVNLSGFKLASQDIIKTIGSAIEQIDSETKNIEIEITENVLIHDTEATVSTLNEIKNLNLRIAMDDFGTGYSSLSYLTSFPVDTIKIDRSFVMDCNAESNNLVIIKAIIAMGHSLGKKIVAEGIETEEQYHLLNDLECDEAQGYYFSHPIPVHDFTKLFARGSL